MSHRRYYSLEVACYLLFAVARALIFTPTLIANSRSVCWFPPSRFLENPNFVPLLSVFLHSVILVTPVRGRAANHPQQVPLVGSLFDGVHLRHQRGRVRHHPQPSAVHDEARRNVYVVSPPGMTRRYGGPRRLPTMGMLRVGVNVFLGHSGHMHTFLRRKAIGGAGGCLFSFTPVGLHCGQADFTSTVIADAQLDRLPADEDFSSPHTCPPFSLPCCAAAVPQSNVQFVVEGFITGVLTLMCGMSGILLVHVSPLLWYSMQPLGPARRVLFLVVAMWIMVRWRRAVGMVVLLFVESSFCWLRFVGCVSLVAFRWLGWWYGHPAWVLRRICSKRLTTASPHREGVTQMPW